MWEVMKQCKIAFILLLSLSILTGLLYPALITGIAQVFFPWHANGSLIWKNDKLIGSELIGQAFAEQKYFWGRPSATSPYPYNAEASSGSNAGPLNTDYLSIVQSRITHLRNANPHAEVGLPIDLVTASGSGLDPEISPQAAIYQAGRIAEVRKLSREQVIKLIQANVQPRLWGVIGEQRVNVLQLNLALDALDRGGNQ